MRDEQTAFFSNSITRLRAEVLGRAGRPALVNRQIAARIVALAIDDFVPSFNRHSATAESLEPHAYQSSLIERTRIRYRKQYGSGPLVWLLLQYLVPVVVRILWDLWHDDLGVRTTLLHASWVELPLPD